MIARLWRARLAPGREADYVAFATMHSLPMFRALPGCLGVRFLGDGLERSVLSLWTDAVAVAALATDLEYLRVSSRLADSGILASVAPVECREVGEDFPAWVPKFAPRSANPPRRSDLRAARD